MTGGRGCGISCTASEVEDYLDDTQDDECCHEAQAHHGQCVLALRLSLEELDGGGDERDRAHDADEDECQVHQLLAGGLAGSGDVVKGAQARECLCLEQEG